MEDILIVVIVFGSGLAALKLILDFVASKRQGSKVSSDPKLTGTEKSILDSVGLGRSRATDRSMTATELSEMIEDTVAKSVSGLEKRVQNLEAIVVDQPMLPEHREQDRLTFSNELTDGETEAPSRPAKLKS